MSVGIPHPVLAVVVSESATDEERDEVIAVTARLNHVTRPLTRGDGWTAITVGDGVRPVPVDRLGSLRGVDRVVPVAAPYCLASRELFAEEGSVRIDRPGGPSPLAVGGRAPILVIASVTRASSDPVDLEAIGLRLRRSGVSVLHAGEISAEGSGSGGPQRTIGEIRRLRDIAREAGLALSLEVSDARQIEEVHDVADVLQTGSRNMQDFSLLREVGRTDRPVLLKRGPGATIEEFLLAGEYVLTNGNGKVLFCESGIRTFDAAGKARFEISAIPLLKRATHLPVLADPPPGSHPARTVPAVALAAVAAGADGLVLRLTWPETGAEPSEEPFEDSPISFATLDELMRSVTTMATAIGRER